MPFMRRPRFLPAALVAVALSALLGGLFGNVATAQDEVTRQYLIYTKALAAVEAEYVEAVPVERLVHASIDASNTLDPHSSFFDPREYAAMRERQSGSYAGLGVTSRHRRGHHIQAILKVRRLQSGSAWRRDCRVEGEDMRAGRRSGGEPAEGTRTPSTSHPRAARRFCRDEGRADEVNITTVRGAFMIDDQTG